jgi:hypothetical protein
VYSCFGIFFTSLPSGLDANHRPLEGEKRRAAQDGRVFESYGICFVPNPYESSGQKKEGNASGTAR